MHTREDRQTPGDPSTAPQQQARGVPSSVSRRRRRRIALALLGVAGVLLALILLTHTGPRLVSLKDSVPTEAIVKLDPSNSPATVGPDGVLTSHWHPAIEASPDPVTLPYHRLTWAVARQPAVHADEAAGERDWVLLDTGWPHEPAVTLDVVARRGLPAHMDRSPKAHVGSLAIGGMTYCDFPAAVWVETWEYRVLSIPVYRLSGWVLGMPNLAQAKYVCFDNTGAEATFGVAASFQPDIGWQWTEYPLPIRRGLPMAALPVAGVPLDLVIDSAGGPKLILNRSDWESIVGKLEVVKHSKGEYPTWGGFQSVDRYKVRRITVGPVALENEWVWVRPPTQEQEKPSSVGLGPFSHTVVVFDFEHSRLLIRTTEGTTQPRPRGTATQ